MNAAFKDADSTQNEVLLARIAGRPGIIQIKEKHEDMPRRIKKLLPGGANSLQRTALTAALPTAPRLYQQI